MRIRINFKKKTVRVIKKRKIIRKKVKPIIKKNIIRVNLNSPVVLINEALYKVDKLTRENKRLRRENAIMKESVATVRDVYRIASEYTETLEDKVDELEDEISNLKESYNYLEYLIEDIKKPNKRRVTKKKEDKPILIDSSHESDESILFELSQTYKEYMMVNEDEMIDINWDKLEDRVGRPIKGIRDEEVKWGFPILNKGQSITDDIVKGFRSEVKEATINARRG